MNRLHSYSAGVVFSVALHVVVFAALVVGWEGKREPEKRIVPQFVNAKLLQVKPTAKPRPAAKPAPAKPPAPKVEDLAKKQQELQRREAEKRRAEEQKQAAFKRKKEQEKRQAEELKRKQAEEAKAKAAREEQERKRREAERRKQQQNELAKALAAEDDFLAADSDALVVDSYSSYIFDRVSNNWSRPPSARRGMEVELLIQLVPTGQLVSVTITKSSGNPAFDRSAEQAVRKVGRFDRLKEVEPRVFEQNFRQFRLLFRPDDLRM